MANAYVGYVKKDGTIKSVFVHDDGEIELLGMNLMEYFTNYTEVKDLVATSILCVNEDEVEYCDVLDELTDDDKEYYLFEDVESFVDDMNSASYYYLFQDNVWFVSKPNHNSLIDLEQVIEEEY